jgi:hypothetical protein
LHTAHDNPVSNTWLTGAGAPIPCPECDKPWVLATAILGSSLAFIEGSVVNFALPAGAAFLPFTLILGFGSTFAGGIFGKVDPRMILTLGPVVAAAGFIALAIPGVIASFGTGFLPGYSAHWRRHDLERGAPGDGGHEFGA